MELKIVDHRTKEASGIYGALDIYINGENVSHCISHMNIKMDAPNKPKVTIECVPDKLSFNADSLIEIVKKENQPKS
ncbi:hypothetical protein [Liquorilactobacillus nagelii]|uniref:hypothetical protein n=1 Tax=Liquorilactobacillus nagelii TaxID=82688 RepID=UPI0039EB6B09